MAIQSAAIGTTNTDLYTSTGSNAVTTLMICNTAIYDPNNPTTGLTYLDLHFVKSGASATTTNMVINQLPVPAGETITLDTERIVLDNGDKVVAKTAAPANLVVTISTLEV